MHGVGLLQVHLAPQRLLLLEQLQLRRVPVQVIPEPVQAHPAHATHAPAAAVAQAHVAGHAAVVGPDGPPAAAAGRGQAKEDLLLQVHLVAQGPRHGAHGPVVRQAPQALRTHPHRALT